MSIFDDEVKLADNLTIGQWVKVRFPDPETQAEMDDRVKRAKLMAKREKLEAMLFDACRAGLKYEGDLGDWYWAPHPRIISNTSYLDSSRSKPGDVGDNVQKYRYRNLPTAKIHKSVFKQFLESIGEWPIEIKGLSNDWWSDGELKAGALGGTDDIKPRKGGYRDRDTFAIELVKQRPELLAMRPKAIKEELQAASPLLFFTGYEDWWREQPVFPKDKGGKNPKATK